MAHQFQIGDIVRLRGTEQDAEVIGLPPSPNGLLHCKMLGVADGQKVYFPTASVSLIIRAGETQANHPQKIET